MRNKSEVRADVGVNSHIAPKPLGHGAPCPYSKGEHCSSERGITLIALVVTIIVLLILAGISLHLISGSNGIITKAANAAKKTQIARYIDSKELSDGMVYTDMMTKDEENHRNLYEYIKEKCEENNDKTGDRLFEGDNGTYWVDDDNHLHFKDNATGMDGIVVKGPDGELILKEVVTPDGEVNDQTTEESLRREIEAAIKDLKEDYEKNKTEGESFQDYVDKKIEEGGGSIKNPDTGGTIKPNGDGSYTYEDLTTPPNTGKITIDENGNTTITDIKINKPDGSEEGGNSGGNTNPGKTEKDLQDELEKALQEQKDKQKEEGNTDSFKDYIDDKIEENGGKLPTPSTGGSISKKDEDTYTYEDKEVPPNKIDFTIDDEGNPVIKDTEINNPGGNTGGDNNSGKTEKDLKDELEKAIQEQKDKQKEEGNTDSFKDYIDKKIEENGGKLPTPSTGGSISKNEDGTYTYEDSEVPPNKIKFDIDEDGNITIIDTEINKPGEKPNINLTVGDIEFEYSTKDWTNQDVTVTAKPTRSIEGYTLETSRNGIVWNKADTQTFKANGTMLVRLTNGKKYGAIATANIENIDKTKPVVKEVTANTYSINIKATDEASGIIGYAVTEDETEPTEFENCENTKDLNTTVNGKKQGQTYYVWVKDEAGNVSNNKKVTLGKVTELKTGDIKIEYTKDDWTNQNVTATFTPNIDIGDFTLQVSDDGGKTWKDATSYEFTENGGIIIALRDKEGQLGKTAATANVTCIDKTAPQVGTVSVTTNSFTFSASDDASGLAGYAITESNTEPTEFTPIEGNPLEFTTTISNKKNNKDYYIWVKDKAGTVSASKKVTLNPVLIPTEGDLTARTSSWNGTTATVTFSTTTSYQIQWSTTQSTNDSDWHTGTSTTVPSGTTVYVRLWDGVNGSTTYISHRPVLTYTITYNANGGTGSTATSTHNYGEAKALTANGFSRTGYTFAGWNTAANGSGTNYSNGQSVTNLANTQGANVTLYAKWTPNTNTPYRVVHQQMNVNGSGYTVVANNTYYGTTGASISPGVNSYTGFSSPAKQTTTIAADGGTVVTYSYTRNRYTISFNSNGGSSCTAITNYYGASVSMPTPSRSGYTFTGWSATYSTMPAQNVSVTASWKATVCCSSCGGHVPIFRCSNCGGTQQYGLSVSCGIKVGNYDMTSQKCKSCSKYGTLSFYSYATCPNCGGSHND